MAEGTVARDVITRTVGSTNKAYSTAVVERAIREMARVKEAEEREKQEKAKALKATVKKKKEKVEKKPEMKRTERLLLGKFNKDVLFLEKFISDSSCKSNVTSVVQLELTCIPGGGEQARAGCPAVPRGKEKLLGANGLVCVVALFYMSK